MRSPPRRAQQSLAISAVPVESLTTDLMDEWFALFAAQEEPANPFCSPTWVIGWYEHYVPARDRALLIARDGSRLVGVAPLYRQRLAVGGVPLANRLMLVGAGRGSSALELPQILTAPGSGRAVTRAVVRRTLTARCDWSELSLARTQGWFEPEWVYDAGTDVAFFRHQLTRACVMLELAGSWEQVRGRFKRNLKESLRRSRNRIAKDGRSWKVVRRAGTDLDRPAVDRLFQLHRLRSEFSGSGIRHPDMYGDQANRDFMRDTLLALSARDEATLVELQLDNRTVAAQLALHAPGCTYIHSSGFEPDLWALGPVSLLQSEVVQLAVERGDRWVNFSPGPNVSKLRWSETIHTQDDFAYGAGRRDVSLRYTAYSLASSYAQARHAVAFVRQNSRRTKNTRQPGQGSRSPVEIP